MIEPTDRLAGYYWLRHAPGEDWTIGCWDDLGWRLLAVAHDEDEMWEIGPMIGRGGPA